MLQDWGSCKVIWERVQVVVGLCSGMNAVGKQG